MQPLLFLGAGGHAREVAIVADAVDATHERWSGHTFIEAADEHDALARGGDVVIALGSPAVRLALWRRHSTRIDLHWPTLIHPRADIGPGNSFGDGILIASGVITTNDIAIGPATLVNLAVTIGHEVVIGAGCALNPGVTISGRVTIGDGCLIGAGAIVLEGLTIGDDATVGAGAVVTHDVPPGLTVVGVPARQLTTGRRT
jgi:sugar O-acyltransferase (sialic acid O-acetyltransferase NeuD family)